MSQTRPRCIKWPPKVQSFTALGHLRDETGNYLPRDIGRSSHFKSTNTTVYQFGDTFCHNLCGHFIGLSNNNCAVIPNVKASTVTRYLTQHATHHQAHTEIEKFNGEGKVCDLIEKSKNSQQEDDTTEMRWKIWAFGGIVEDCERSGGMMDAVRIGKGWTFFETWRDDLRTGEMGIFEYTGLAEVFVSEERAWSVVIESARRGRRLFDRDEPRFGSFCAIAEGDYLYTYGHIGDYHPPPSHINITNFMNPKDIVLARVPLSQISNRSSYQFFNGTAFTSTISTISPVLRDMQHGQIFHSSSSTSLFGASSPYRFAFIGNNARGDSKIQMGRARSVEGPWEVVELRDVELYALNDKEDKGMFDFRYCVYPHAWACEWDGHGDDRAGRGDLMISWSEGGMSGGVLAGVLRFESICESK